MPEFKLWPHAGADEPLEQPLAAPVRCGASVAEGRPFWAVGAQDGRLYFGVCERVVFAQPYGTPHLLHRRRLYPAADCYAALEDARRALREELDLADARRHEIAGQLTVLGFAPGPHPGGEGGGEGGARE